MSEALTRSCPCFNCLCLPVCKQAKWTYDILMKCSLVKRFYQNSHPYYNYQSFVSIRKCLGFKFGSKITYDKMYGDWQNLLNRVDYAMEFNK